MKPFIIPTPPLSKDGKIHLTPDELNNLIEIAYNAGYSDGQKNHSITPYPYLPTTPTVWPDNTGWPLNPCTWNTSTSTSTATYDPNCKLTQATVNWIAEIAKAV